MKRFLRVITVFIGVLVIAFTVFLLVNARTQLAAYIERYALEQYGLKIDIGSLNYEPFPLTISAQDVRLFGGPKNDRVFFQATSIELELTYSSLWSDRFHVPKIEINSPSVFADALPPFRQKQAEKGTFQVDEITINNGSADYQQYKVRNIQSRLAASSSEIRIESLRAEYAEASLSLNGVVKNQESPEYDLHYDIDADASILKRLQTSAPELSGPVHSSGQFTGVGTRYEVQGFLEGKAVKSKAPDTFYVGGKYDIRAEGSPLASIDVTFKNVPSSLLSDHFPEAPRFATILSGNLRYAGGNDPWKSDSTFWINLEPAKGEWPSLQGELDGSIRNGKLFVDATDLKSGRMSVTLSGQFTPGSIDAQVDAIIPSARDLKSFAPDLAALPGSYRAEARLQGPYENIGVFGTVVATHPDFSMKVNGEYWLGSRKIRAEGGGTLGAKFLNDKLSGPLLIEGTLNGSTSQPRLNAKLHGKQLRFSNLSIGDLNAELNSNGKIIRLSALLPEYSSSVEGAYEIAKKDFQVKGEFKGLSMKQLQPFLPTTLQDASGSLTASLEASGRLPQWKNSIATLTFQQAKIEKNGISISINPESSLRLEQRRIQADLNLESAEGSASIRGNIPIDQSHPLDLKASGDANLSLLRLFTNVFEATGSLRFDMVASGRMKNPSVTGEVTSQDLELRWPEQKLELADATLNARFADQWIEVQGTGNLRSNRSDVTGSAAIALNASGEGAMPETWTAVAKITTDQLTIGETSVVTESPLQISLAKDIVELKRVKLRAGELLDINARGKWNLKSKKIEAETETSADFSLISRFYPEIRAAGDLRATAKIEGTSEAPQFAGEVQLENGMMRLEGYPMVLENIHMVAPLQKDGLRIDTLTANLGGGKVEANGHIFWDQKSPNAVDIRVLAKNVSTNYPEDLRSILNTDLTFQGGKDNYTLSGKVDVLRSAYREDIDPRGRLIHTLLAHQRELLPETESISNRIHLRIDVQTLRDAIMDNNIGRLRASASLKVGGTLYEPLLTGSARIKEGSYLDFENHTYTVEEATVNYRNSEILNPEVLLRLSTEAEYQEGDERRECDIELTVAGSLKDPDVKPPHSASCSDLESYQIYSLLLTGTTELTTGSRAFFTQQLAAYLSGSVLYGFQKSISRGLGLNTFTLEPLIIASESNPGARLTLGKRLSRELDLAYSLSLTESTDQLWLANYRIRNNFNLRLVEQENTFTTSLRHRFHFGGGGRVSIAPIAPLRTQTIKNVVYENDTQISEETLQDRLAKAGERYSFWKIQSGADELKKELQKSGYLFPWIEIQETAETESTVDLHIRVSGQGKREFVISGFEVDSSKLSEYRGWWREAFSEASALTQMEDDLMQTAYAKGYFNATVQTSTEERAGTTIYRFNVNPGTQWEQARLVFSGQKWLTADELQNRLRSFYLSNNEMISEAIHRFPQFSRKITALYAEQGLLNPHIRPGKINYYPAEKSIEVPVLIDEGPRSMVAELDVSQDQTLPADLVADLQLRPGAVYLPLAIYDDQKTVLQYYKANGYWNTQVDAHARPLKNSSEIMIQYDLYPGTRAKVHSVEIRGNTQTREGIIRKELKLHPGDEITDEAISEAQDRLYALHVFNSINIHLENTDEPQMFDVVVELVENKKFAVTYGGRYDTEENFEGEAQLEDQNFLGTAQSVFVYGRWNNREKRYQFGYNSPSIFGWHWNSFFFAERVNRTDLDLIQTNFNFQQQTHLGNSIVLQSGYRFTRNKTNLEIPGEGPQEFILSISRLQSAVFADFRDNPIDATRGFFASTALEYAPEFLGSDATFLKSYSLFYYYHPVSRLTVASAVRVGLATTFQQQFLLTAERFFAGGSDTLRGFRFEQVGPRDEIFNEPLGGEAVLILNEELRFPIYRWFRGVAFYDIGNVYEEVTDFSLSDLRYSAGLGVRVALPYGILGRIDVGFNLSPRNDEPHSVFHFSIGQAF